MKSERIAHWTRIEPWTRREGAIAAAVAVAIFAYTYLGLRWLLTPPVLGWSPQAGRILLLERLGLSVAAGVLVILLVRSIHRRGGATPWIRYHAYAFAAFAALLSAGCVLLAILDPGVVDEDFFYSLHMARSGGFSDWYSYVHPVLTQLVALMLPFPAGFAFVNLAGLAGVLSAYYATAIRHGANVWLSTVVLVACALTVPTWFSALRPTRDSWFTVLFLAWLLVIWRDLLRGRPLAGSRIPLHIGAATLLSLYRPDAFPGAVLLIALLAARSGPRRISRSVLSACGFVVVFAMASIALPRFLMALNPNVQSRSAEYMITLVVNPLGHLLQQGYRPHDAATDERILGQVIDLQQARKVSVAFNIPVFYQNHWNTSSTLAQREAFRDRALLLFAENPGLFVESRWRTFAIAAGLQEGRTGTYYRRDATRGKFPWPTPVASRFPNAERRIWATIDSSLAFDGIAPWGKFVHWNLLPALFACLVLMLFWSWVPATATLAMAVLLRSAMLFVAEPASFFQYHLALYLAPFLLIPLAVAEWRRSPGGIGTWRRPPDTTRAGD